MSTHIGILPFRIGEAPSTIVSDRYARFYERVGKLATGDAACSISQAKNLRTIAIPQASVKSDNTIFTRARDGLSRYSNRCQLLIVDLATPPRATFPNFNILQSVMSALSSHWWTGKRKKRLVVILLPRPLSDEDVAYELMQDRIKARCLAVIDNDGAVHGTLPIGLNRQDYRAALREVQDDPLTILSRKMIRRIGHFRYSRYGQASYATKFFYDGQLCGNEIVRLLEIKFSAGMPRRMIIHAPNSSWLANAAEAFCAKHDTALLDLSRISLTEYDSEIAKFAGDKDVFVLLPMVDSGRTLQLLDSKIRMSKSTPNYMTVLSTDGDKDADGVRVVGESPAIETKYLLRVKQVRYEAGKEPHSLRRHEGSGFDLSAEPPVLTSYVFWEMIAEQGFKEEQDVPERWRRSLGLVPKFPEVLRANGPLLAYKIDICCAVSKVVYRLIQYLFVPTRPAPLS